jgi:hypothetical protein
LATGYWLLVTGVIMFLSAVLLCIICLLLAKPSVSVSAATAEDTDKQLSATHLEKIQIQKRLLTAAEDSKTNATPMTKNMTIATQTPVPVSTPLFYDQFRVHIDELPKLYDVPSNVSWSELTHLKKITASAAYDIFKAQFRGEEVVVKTLRNQTRMKSRNGAPKEMEKEIKVLSRLNHPNIISIKGHGML